MVAIEPKDIEQTEKSLSELGYNFTREQIKIAIPYAKQNFMRGMMRYCGTEVNWMEGYDEIVNWLSDNQGKGLLLIGGVGLGKSIFCMKVLPVLINFYHRKLVYSYYADEINNKRNEIFTKKLVCLDDIGSESELNEFGCKKRVFCEIIDKAERNKSFVIINTNLTTDEIEERYGERTLDRLKALTKIVRLDGESNR